MNRLTRRRRSTPALVRARLLVDAWDEFYGAYAEQIFRFFLRRLFDPEVALDLTGETFAVCWRSRAQFRGTTEREQTAWLYAVAHSQLTRYCRRGDAERRALEHLGVEVPPFSDGDLERVEHDLDFELGRSDVAAALRALPTDQRRAVELRVIQEREYEDIARLLEVSEQVVRARVSRGLRTMAQQAEAT
jgi:RNA polymerase sigma-70 factor (ECF subfamily)